MDGKTVDAVLLECVGYKLLLVHNVFGKGALHAEGVRATFLLPFDIAVCHTFKFTVKAVYYYKAVAGGYTLEELQLTLKYGYGRNLCIEEYQASALHVTVYHETELLDVALAILRVKGI